MLGASLARIAGVLLCLGVLHAWAACGVRKITANEKRRSRGHDRLMRRGTLVPEG